MPVKEAHRYERPTIICSKNSGLDRRADLFSMQNLVPIVVFSPHLPTYSETPSNEQLLPPRLRFVPFEAKQAGRMLGEIKNQHANFRGATKNEIAIATATNSRPVTTEDINRFIRGTYTHLGLNLRQIYQGATKVYAEEDPIMIALENLTLEQDSLRTISQERRSLGKSIRFLRLAQKLSLSELAKRSGLTKEQIHAYETEYKGPPWGFNMNRLIKGLQLPEDSKVGQLLHLKREKKDPMTMDKLQSCSLGELMRYMRILKGFSEIEMAKKLGKIQSEISDYERFRQVPETILNKFISWFTETSDSTLVDVLRQKWEHPKKRISQPVINKILKGKYLFAEHIEQLEPYTPTTQDVDLMEQLDDLPTVGAMLQFMIDKKGITMAEITRRGNISVKPLYSLLTGTPTDINIVKIAQTLGHDIYYPVAQFLLDRAENERAEKKQQKKPSKNEPVVLLKAS